MKYRLLGRSGLRVSELGLGTMTFGEEWGWGAAKDEARRMFEAYLEFGGNFIDTAGIYTEGSSERWLGELIAGRRDHLVIATKYTCQVRPGDPNACGNHRKSLVQALEASLERLGVDYIDVYWVHVWDELTPIEEVMRALDDQVRAGKVLYVGISDAPAWLAAQGNTLAEARGWSPFVGLSLEYSLVQRTAERELLPMARALGLGVTAWAPLANGLLSGNYSSSKQPAGGAHRLDHPTFRGLRSERNLRIADAVIAVARALGRSPAQVAINWVRSRSGVIPLLGARDVAQLADALGCLSWTLPPEHIAELDAVSHIELGFPHDFIASAGVRRAVHGGTWEQIVR